MLVYHFVSKEYALKNIVNNQLKIATINELNDPYEFYVGFGNSGQLFDEEISVNIQEHYSNIMGFLCFSKNWKNPVLWSHYADKHEGICMEFDIPDRFLKKIEYKRELTIIDASDNDWRTNFAQATLAKYEHWSYEEEYRIPVQLNSHQVLRENGRYFMPFSDEMALRRIFLGSRCKLIETDEQNLKQRQIPIIYTCLSRNFYSVIEKEQLA